MIELGKAIVVLIASVIVTIIIMPILILWSLGHGLVMMVRGKNIFKLIWRYIDGTAYVISNFIYNIALSLDMLWNVFGEAFEDVFTHKEETQFGKRNMTVSAAVGHLELTDLDNKWQRRFSNLLNKVFMQKNHAVDSWMVRKAIGEIRNEHFK